MIGTIISETLTGFMDNIFSLGPWSKLLLVSVGVGVFLSGVGNFMTGTANAINAAKGREIEMDEQPEIVDEELKANEVNEEPKVNEKPKDHEEANEQ
jgi:hypothetical protein